MPEWIVVGAGTGGTSATIGRYIRYRRHATRLGVVDPENSAFFPAYARRTPTSRRGCRRGSRASAGRAWSRRSCPGHRSHDRVPDAASIATARHASVVLGRRVGGSTGTNLWGAFTVVAEMIAARRSGSVVTLLADGGDRYADTYFDDEWVAGEGLDPSDFASVLVEFERSGSWP